MQFDWKNPTDDIHVCNDGAAQVPPGKEPGIYRAEVFNNGGISVAKIEKCSGLKAAKQLAEAQLEKLASATAG